MKSPLHAHDRHTLQITENHLALVTLDSGDREVWDVFVRETLLVLDRLRQRTWTQLVLLICSYLGIDRTLTGPGDTGNSKAFKSY